MCERIVENELRRLGFVPDRFVTFKTLKDLDKDEDLDNGVLDKLITKCNGYKQRKALEKQIVKELRHMAWHPSQN